MTRSIAVRILIAAGLIGLAAQAVLLHSLLGINAPLLTAILLGAAFVLRREDRSLDRVDRWLPSAALAMSAGIAIRADPVLLQLDVAAACLLIGASMAAIGGEAVTRRSAARVVELGLVVLGSTGAGILRVTAALSRPDRAADSAPALLGRGLPAIASPILRGILIAIPVLVVFAVLFSAADAAFDRLMARFFTWNIDLGEAPLRLVVAFLIAWVVAGLLAVATGAVRATNPGHPRSGGGAAIADPWPHIRLGAIEAATVLIAVDVLFGLFVIVQLAYLFGGLDTLAATGLPYAQYARSGFFELVWVAFLAGGLLAVVHAVAARRTEVLVGAGLALAGLTAAVLASALLRLRIYQDAYGWTELRFYVLAAIVWLAIGIGITVSLLARDRMRWLLHGLAIAAVAVLLGVNLVGPSRVIAEQNVARVLNPSLVPPDGQTGLDVTYATRLGDDAIPALVAALPALDPADRSELQLRLRLRRTALSDADADGWPSWNLGRQLARDALATLDR